MKKTANAKINIALQIKGIREDGYHELDMIFLELPFGDVIEIEKAEEGICLQCSDVSLPTDERNLAFKAAKLMKEVYAIPGGVTIRIEKKIPSQAGLGGGSSDAACVLKGMNELFGLHAQEEELEKLAERLGADVPFLVQGGCVRARGKGEILSPVGIFPPCHILVVKPDVSVSTPWAYRAFDACKKEPASMNIEKAVLAIQNKDLKELCSHIGNDLEAPVLEKYPVIGEIKKQLYSNGAAFAMMTGSGSAVFGIFEEEAKACPAKEVFERAGNVQTFLVSF